MKGYVMEVIIGGKYQYLFVEKSTVKATMDEYEKLYGNRPSRAQVTKRSGKTLADEVKDICVNL